MHTIHPYLLRRTIKVAVVGCGGTGSALVGGLPHLHQALIACGHPSGLAVTVIDGDRISAANCVRQPFSASEIGLFKSVVLINRLNLFLGTRLAGRPATSGNGARSAKRSRPRHRLCGQPGRPGKDTCGRHRHMVRHWLLA
jgi:PRTRC genetic system ThiF family protein